MSSTENNLYNKNDEINQLILNISYETETGKLILSDNYNNHYLCDLFGRIKTKFKPNITGHVSYTQRQKIDSARFSNPNTKRSVQSTKPEETLSRPHTSKAFFSPQRVQTDYHPSIRRFEGYSKFPRPLSPPFSNLPDNELKELIKTDLIKHLEKHFSTNQTRNIILNKNFNKGLSYLTSDLNEFDCMKVDNKKILELIKKTLDTIREKYVLKMKLFYKDPYVKALTQFSKYLLSNKDATIINNRKLPGPNPTIKKRYECIQSAIARHGLFKKNNENHKNNNKLTLDNDKESNHIKRNIYFRDLALDACKGINANKKIKAKNKIEIFNNLFKKDNDFNIGKRIPMVFGSFSYEEEAKNKQNENTNTLTQENKTTKKQKHKQKGKESKKDIKGTTKGTIENKEKRNKTIDIRLKYNNISFISNMSENEKKYEEKNIKRVKGLTIIQNNYEKECNLLKGLKVKKRKAFMHLFKNARPKYKNNGELYEKDIDLLRKTNPIAFKLQEKKDEFDFKQLIKKVESQRINSDNIMKGKKLKIQNPKEND